MTPERKPVVVHRPEPPPEDGPAHAQAKLSQDEMRALLAVAKTAHPPWRRAARRGVVAALPSLVLSFVLDAWLGWWSIPVVVLLAIGWSAGPLLRQSRDGWT